MSVRGDFGGLQQLARKMRTLGSDAFRARVNRIVAEEAIDQIKLCFVQGRDPYGEPWAPLKAREGMPLRDTGRLMNSLTRAREVTPTGFRVGTNVVYAKYHQFGTQGRSRATTRAQAIDERGKFMSQKKARRRRGAGFVVTSVGVRLLSFGVGSGKIPPRPFLPTHGMPPTWARAFRAAAQEAVAQMLRK